MGHVTIISLPHLRRIVDMNSQHLLHGNCMGHVTIIRGSSGKAEDKNIVGSYV